PRASHAIVKGRIGDREAYVMAIIAFAIAFALGVYLVSMRGWPIVALGLAGLVGGYTYTAPPFQYKFGSFGIPLVFLLLGPLAVTGSYYAITGTIDWSALAIIDLQTAQLHAAFGYLMVAGLISAAAIATR